ncbi:MAG TPA: Imm21 family immunity protein, partial [Archangium sp.]|nr:Imm21 family immunity protein [Archangium sp.]
MDFTPLVTIQGREQRGATKKAMGEPMQWVFSAGGPLVLLPKAVQPRWRGTCGVPSDYEVACSVEGYVGVIEKAGRQILVLGDEPLQTAVSR